MSRTTSVNHPIKKHIIDLLTHQKVVRFSDLRPPRTETNLFTYHLNSLVKLGIVDRLEDGYTLHALGFSRLMKHSGGPASVQYFSQSSFNQQFCPVIMFVVQNDEGDVLLQRKTTQPFIDSWTLPGGNFKVDSQSLEQSAKIMLGDFVNPKHGVEIEHAGDCYVRVYADKTKDSSTSVNMVHVFRFYTNDAKVSDNYLWARPHKLNQLELAPATQDIMTRTFFKDPFFFEEFNINLLD